jgi:hypothetical protein
LLKTKLFVLILNIIIVKKNIWKKYYCRPQALGWTHTPWGCGHLTLRLIGMGVGQATHPYPPSRLLPPDVSAGRGPSILTQKEINCFFSLQSSYAYVLGLDCLFCNYLVLHKQDPTPSKGAGFGCAAIPKDIEYGCVARPNRHTS